MLDLFINEILVGSTLPTVACDCTGDTREVTFTDAATLALIDPALCNRFRVTESDGRADTRFGFVQVTLQTSDGTQEVCLFDGSATNPSPTCADRALCDPPGLSEGVGTAEGTLCAVCSTGMVDGVHEPDIDGDGIGDTCDDVDAALTIRRLRWRGTTSTERPTGTVIVSGDVLLASADDRLDAAGGIAVQISDGLGLAERFLWAAGNCQELASGYISCRSFDGLWTGTFDPRVTPGRYSFNLSFDQVASQAPFQPPVTVRITDHPPLAVVGTDRVGTVADCTVSNNSIRCLEP
jgi:hypothetical protein